MEGEKLVVKRKRTMDYQLGLLKMEHPISSCLSTYKSVNTPAAARKPTTAIEMDTLAGLATRMMPQSYAAASQASSRTTVACRSLGSASRASPERS